MNRLARPSLMLALALSVASVVAGCRDYAPSDQYPYAMDAGEQRLLPTATRTYDNRIMAGTAQVIGLQGNDATLANPANSRSSRSRGADDNGPVGSIRSAFSALNEAARRLVGTPESADPDGEPDPENGNH